MYKYIPSPKGAGPWHDFCDSILSRPSPWEKRLEIELREPWMFDIDTLLKLGVFNQLIPIWQVFFFIASLLPFLLWDRVKICLLITYLFTYYLGFLVQWGDYISSTGSMQPFVLYSLSGLAIAVFFVATIFTETSAKPGVRRYPRRSFDSAEEIELDRHRDPLHAAVNVTPAPDNDSP